MKADIVIVGAGISGLVLAERYANFLNKSVLIIEKCNHIGGYCYDYEDEGILVSKYGAHIFRTNNEDVWKYVNGFSKWFRYEHKVLSWVDGKLVPIPVNIETLNVLFNLNITCEEEADNWFKSNTIKKEFFKNSEEVALSRVGKVLYEKMFKNYTKKQWDLWPSELDASVMARIPVRNNFDCRYFNQKYQALPEHGYTKMFEKMIENKNIEVVLNTNFIDVRDDLKFEKLFFTGPIDLFFDYKYGKLKYRCLDFKFETIDSFMYQCNSVINYPELKYPFTRIVEYKHFYNNEDNKVNRTVISKEYPSWYGDPCYPVPSSMNQKVYNKYALEAEKIKKDGVFFVGRLANYKYIDMEQAFKNALDLFNLVK